MFNLFTNLRRSPQEEVKSYNSSLSKSVNPQTSASVFIGGDGSLLKTLYYTAYDEIARNISVNTIISKQSSIVNEAGLVVREKDNDNKDTTKKEFLDFISWIENPNCHPSPRTKSDIFNYIFDSYYKTGLFGIIFIFDKQGNFKYIRIPTSIKLENYTDETKFRVHIKTSYYTFTFNQKYRNFAIEGKEENMILMYGGRFDNELQQFSPIFNGSVMPYIMLQNNLIDFATSFHQNACFPSQIVTLNYVTEKDSGGLDPKQAKEFDDAVKAVEKQINESRGSKNSGGIIIPKNPNIKVDITPLSTPTGAIDNIKYQDFVSYKIYSVVDGATSEGLEGKGDYLGSMVASQDIIYGGAFRQVRQIAIAYLNLFMQSLIGSLNKNINPLNYYLVSDISQVQYYEAKFFNQIVLLVQNNILKINEARDMISKTSDRFAFLEADEDLDVVNAELSGNATKAPPTV